MFVINMLLLGYLMMKLGGKSAMYFWDNIVVKIKKTLNNSN
jgi:cytochrome b561